MKNTVIFENGSQFASDFMSKNNRFPTRNEIWEAATKQEREQRQVLEPEKQHN